MDLTRIWNKSLGDQTELYKYFKLKQLSMEDEPKISWDGSYQKLRFDRGFLKEQKQNMYPNFTQHPFMLIGPATCYLYFYNQDW